jgi:hypothetical protein
MIALKSTAKLMPDSHQFFLLTEAAMKNKVKSHARVAELVDALDLGSSSS